MTNLRTVLVIAAIVVPGLARADEALPDPQSLATVEAILDYCVKVDPPDAEKYRERVRLVVQGANEDALAKLRKSEGYQQKRVSVEDFLAKVDEHNVRKVCAPKPASGE